MFFFRDIGVAAAKVVVNDFSWSVEKLTKDLDVQRLVADQKLSESETELYFEERLAFRKIVLNFRTWTFKSG